MHGPTLLHTWSKLTELRRIAIAMIDTGMNTVKRDRRCWHHTGSWKEEADIDKVNRHCIKVINFQLIFFNYRVLFEFTMKMAGYECGVPQILYFLFKYICLKSVFPGPLSVIG